MYQETTQSWLPEKAGWQWEGIPRPGAYGSLYIAYSLLSSAGVDFGHWQEGTLAETPSQIDRWIDLLAGLYEFRGYTDVSAFLRANPFLTTLLLEACWKVKECFGRGVPVALEVFTDPEQGNGKELFALILTDLNPEEALRGLSRLDDEWWLEASPRARCLLNIDIEYL